MDTESAIKRQIDPTKPFKLTICWRRRNGGRRRLSTVADVVDFLILQSDLVL